jgi:hypothetical protein
VQLKAQVEQTQRIEFELNDEDDRVFNIVTAGEEGLVLYREVKNRETRMERKWEVIHLDTTLSVLWRNYYYVDLRYIYSGWEYCDGQFYMLFRQNVESIKANLQILRLNLDNQQSSTFLIERDFPLELSQFEVVRNTLIFGGYANTRPAVVAYIFGDTKPIVLPGFYNQKSELMQIEVDDAAGTFNVLTSLRQKDGSKTIDIKTFDQRGEMLKNVLLQPSNERSLLYGRSVTLKDNIHLIAGTYTRKRSDMSRGIFLARIAPDGEHVINYYNYADLKNFFSYMKAKREKRIKERIERRKIKGKKNRFNYRLLVHDVVEAPNGNFIMIGEAFYPKYSHNSFYSPFGGYSRYMGDYGMMFDGYRYTHAVVIGFDTNGRVQWDNSFEINDVESFELEQFVHVAANDDKVVLAYLFENVVRTKVVYQGEVLEGKSFNDLMLSFEDDVISDKDSEYEGMESWYGNVMIAFGVQQLKNLKSEGVKLNRDVFFINKLRFDGAQQMEEEDTVN